MHAARGQWPRARGVARLRVTMLRRSAFERRLSARTYGGRREPAPPTVVWRRLIGVDSGLWPVLVGVRQGCARWRSVHAARGQWPGGVLPCCAARYERRLTGSLQASWPVRVGAPRGCARRRSVYAALGSWLGGVLPCCVGRVASGPRLVGGWPARRCDSNMRLGLSHAVGGGGPARDILWSLAVRGWSETVVQLPQSPISWAWY